MPLAGSSTEHVFSYRERWRCFQEKYYLGYVLLEHLSIATDIQFHIFNFKFACHGYLQKKAYTITRSNLWNVLIIEDFNYLIHRPNEF